MKPAGITPTTVTGSPSTKTVSPIADGDAPYRRCQSEYESTAFRVSPGLSTRASSDRPDAAGTLKTENKRLKDDLLLAKDRDERNHKLCRRQNDKLVEQEGEIERLTKELATTNTKNAELETKLKQLLN